MYTDNLKKIWFSVFNIITLNFQFPKYRYICTPFSNMDQVLQLFSKVDNTIQKSILK